MFLLHHPIWVEEEYKERKRTGFIFREHVRGEQITKTNKKTLLDVTFQLALYDAFGEINLYNLV